MSRHTAAPTTEPPGLAEAMLPDLSTTLAHYGKAADLSAYSLHPLNADSPNNRLTDEITPTARIFMRNHHPIPDMRVGKWRLTIDGLVRRPLEISYAELLKMPRSTYVAVLQGSLKQDHSGTNRLAVANAEWTGVPLALLLEQAGVKMRAKWADCVGVGDPGYGMTLPLSKLFSDAMLAYALNEAPLPPAHGGPVRLIVPGRVGATWVKWINQITLTAHDHNATTDDAAEALQVNARIMNPQPGAVLKSARTQICGFAWSGGHAIVRVELSIDGGNSWKDAQLLTNFGPRAWRPFLWSWYPRPGQYTLMARATDSRGVTQPLATTEPHTFQLANTVFPVPVTIV